MYQNHDYNCTIMCEICNRASLALDWCENAAGQLPPDTYQCPRCSSAFKRQRIHKQHSIYENNIEENLV